MGSFCSFERKGRRHKMKFVGFLCLVSVALAVPGKKDRDDTKKKMKDRKDKIAKGEAEPPSWQELIATFGMQIFDVVEEIMETGENPFGDMSFGMGMQMAQIGSNYFVGGDFVVPHDCDIAAPAIDTAETFMSENGKILGETDKGMGMAMNQVGSNFFVMGDYVRPDKDFIDIADFNSCFTEDNEVSINDTPNVVSMKQKDAYDCVMEKEVSRRKAVKVHEPTM